MAQVADVVGGRSAPMDAVQRMEGEKSVPGEFSDVKHVRGILSMGRWDDPNSGTSSFSVLLGNAPHLDHTVRPWTPYCPVPSLIAKRTERCVATMSKTQELIPGYVGAQRYALDGRSHGRRTASKTDGTQSSLGIHPMNASSAPWSATPSLQRSYQLGTEALWGACHERVSSRQFRDPCDPCERLCFLRAFFQPLKPSRSHNSPAVTHA